MPNWCNNSLEVKGKKEDLDKFKVKYKGTFTDKKEDITWLDFTKIIPNQENKNLWKTKWEELSEKDKNRWNNDFDHYWFNMSGHKWQSDNWGTKWNADIGEPREEDGKLYYGFSTAWSPCDKIVKKLIETHPELEFNLEFEEWGLCFMGEITGKDGEVMTDITEDCEITLEIDFEKLYYNMHDASADWLYNLEEWDNILSKEKRDEITREFNQSKIFTHEAKKVGRNDPCPCGSGKKFKKCCINK